MSSKGVGLHTSYNHYSFLDLSDAVLLYRTLCEGAFPKAWTRLEDKPE